MPKLKVENLKRIREAGRASVCLRQGAGEVKVTVHMGDCGIAAGAREIVKALLQELKRREVSEVLVTISGCAGYCDREPTAKVEVRGQEPVTYINLDRQKIHRILEEHILGGAIVHDYTDSSLPKQGPVA
jgi:NADP-reducing hydrogenase subunit HndB